MKTRIFAMCAIFAALMLLPGTSKITSRQIAATVNEPTFSAASYAAWGTLDGNAVAIMKKDGSHLPLPISGMGQKIESPSETYTFPSGNTITLKYTLSRSTPQEGGSARIWYHTEIMPSPSSTIPGAGWPALSQVVVEGDMELWCDKPLAQAAKVWLTLGEHPCSICLETGWFDYNLRGLGLNGSDLRVNVRKAFYPKTPGQQDFLRDGTVVSYGELEVFDLPGNGRVAFISALRIIDAARRTDLRVAVSSVGAACSGASCPGTRTAVTRESQNRGIANASQ